MKNLLLIIAIWLIALFIGCGGGGIKLQPTSEDQFNVAREKYDNEKWMAAIEAFQRVIFNYPGATVVDTAQYYLAMSYFGNKEYELSAVEFRRLQTSYPQSEFRDEGQYMEALSFLKNTPGHYSLDQGELETAIGLLQEFIIDNPDSPLKEKVLGSINEGLTKLAQKDYENGILYFKMYNYKAAEKYFQHVIDSYTNTKFAPMSLFKLAEVSMKIKKYEEALTRLNNFKLVFPNSDLIIKIDEYIDEVTRDMEAGNGDEKS